MIPKTKTDWLSWTDQTSLYYSSIEGSSARRETEIHRNWHNLFSQRDPTTPLSRFSETSTRNKSLGPRPGAFVFGRADRSLEPRLSRVSSFSPLTSLCPARNAFEPKEHRRFSIDFHARIMEMIISYRKQFICYVFYSILRGETMSPVPTIIFV